LWCRVPSLVRGISIPPEIDQLAANATQTVIEEKTPSRYL
jgi:hypothetical protein